MGSIIITWGQSGGLPNPLAHEDDTPYLQSPWPHVGLAMDHLPHTFPSGRYAGGVVGSLILRAEWEK